MKRSRLPWRFIFYLVVLLYLAGDLFLFDGPIRKKIDHRRSVKAIAENSQNGNWVAVVNGEPITTAQLDLATRLTLHRRGQSADDVTPANYSITRRATLQQVVNDTLIRQYAKGDGWKASEEEVERRIASFRSQFPEEANLKPYDEAQDLSGAERDELLTRMANEESWIEHKISEGMKSITEEQVRAFYDENAKEGTGFHNPLRFRARHLFLSTVEHKEREEEIRSIRAELTKENFDTLTREHSDDERTKHRGGELGWFSERGIPADFFVFVKEQRIGEISEPFRSTLGWHLVEVQERAERELLPYESVKEEIRNHLENELRADLVTELLGRLRRVAIIRVFPDNL